MDLFSAFPNLMTEGFNKTSPTNRAYNCIAWAVGDSSLFWWPEPQSHWPPSITRESTLEAFQELFESLGYAECDVSEFEPGFEKVALYALDNEPTHASRQLPNGRWTSKLGKSIDIEHTLSGLNGPIYGEIVKIFRRET